MKKKNPIKVFFLGLIIGSFVTSFIAVNVIDRRASKQEVDGWGDPIEYVRLYESEYSNQRQLLRNNYLVECEGTGYLASREDAQEVISTYSGTNFIAYTHWYCGDDKKSYDRVVEPRINLKGRNNETKYYRDDVQVDEEGNVIE